MNHSELMYNPHTIHSDNTALKMTVIRPAQAQDIPAMLQIWLDSSLLAHDFIPADYWQSQLVPMQQTYLPLAENFIIEDHAAVLGFASLLRDVSYLAALFIAPHAQGRGLGTRLLHSLQQQCDALYLDVYSKNQSAVHFYQSHGFCITGESMDEHTGHLEYRMAWSKHSTPKN